LLTVLRTFAVAVIVIVTGTGPQSNVMMPPAATALTTAAEVQLAAVPLPILRVGLLVSTGRAVDGTAACPFGLPGLGRVFGLAGGVAEAEAGVDGEADAGTDADGPADKSGEGADGAAESTNDGASAAPDAE
jgi:hypothetical protein